MRKYSLLFISFGVSFFTAAQSLQQLESSRVMLPNGWGLTPVGKSLPLGDLPLNIAVSPSRKLMAVTNNGQSVQSIQLIDARKEKVLDAAVIPKSWYGLKFSADNKYLYASGGNDNRILKYKVQKNKLVLIDSILLGKKWPERISPAGIDIDDARNLLYVVTKENNSLYIVDLAKKEIKKKIPIGGEGYSCLLSPDKKILYISCWGCDKVIVYNTDNGNKSEIDVGDNPNELLLNKTGTILYVANANDNSVSVISTSENKVIETLNAALFPNAPPGSTSNGLALNATEKRLYIANADNNCLAVFDVSKPGFSHSEGFIPTGWYPTNVKVIGKKIFVANGKGFSSKPNAKGPDPTNKEEEVEYQKALYNKNRSQTEYIGGLFKGTMSIINEPGETQLGIYSSLVYKNTAYKKEQETMASGEVGNPIPMKVGDKSPIKYIFYVIKENRTYDQVLSDIPGGNGDTSLLLFGERITPNQHKLAKEFVLFDNFYVDGEVSADGHNWTMGAYATDFLEKSWPTNYSGRGGDYNGEGTRVIANNKGGFIWDHCKKAGVSYRSYGEFTEAVKKGNIPSLQNHFSSTYTGWDMNTKDTTRFYQWQKEFDSLLKINAVPRFNSLRMGNDHTSGLRKGSPTPFAHVADNDLAVGLLVDYLSKSPIWKETAIFIVEDDAQNGPDHVDAHRTTAYVAGGFVKRKFIDHTMYSTSSMLRTIELILGIPPMTQYDAAAEPMWRSFTPVANLTPFNALPSNINLNDKNVAVNKWQQKSETFNFAKEDSAPDVEFSEVIWHAVKGETVKFPGPRRAAFLKIKEEKDDD